MFNSLFRVSKARVYHLTRNRVFLAKLTAAIIAGGFLIACGVVAISGRRDVDGLPRSPFIERLQQKLTKIEGSASPDKSRALAQWLHGLTKDVKRTAEVMKVPAPTLDAFEKSPVLFGFKLDEIFQHNVSDAAARARFHDYLLARIDHKDTRGLAAWKRLETAALGTPPLPFANEFLGDLLDDEDKPMEALHAFQREGEFVDARQARARALLMAINVEELHALREMMSDARYAGEATPWMQRRAGLLLDDWRILLTGLLRMTWEDSSRGVLIAALFAAGLWYAVFVRCGVRERWRWVRPLPALIAGVLSIWPTLMLIHFQETIMGHEENGDFLHDLIYFVAGVGLREEACKLALFALFIPWLLKHRTPGKAMLTGAFIGLGFALDENRQYYTTDGIAHSAVARLLTANFFHAAMTGLAADSLYEMVRTRFDAAEQFIATFIAVVVVHGVYDWVLSAGSSLQVLGSLGMFSIIIIALTAERFFGLLSSLIQPQRGNVSLLSLFVIGIALLVAAGFILAAVQDGTLAAVSAVGTDALSLVPITVFYVRKFDHL